MRERQTDRHRQRKVERGRDIDGERAEKDRDRDGETR